MEAMGSDADHGLDPEIACLVSLFWLASGTSYHVISRAFDMPQTSFYHAIHTTTAKIASLFAVHRGLQQGGWEH